MAEPAPLRPMDATLEGYEWLPRMIDKARALENGTLGDRLHPCPVDATALRKLHLDVRTFDDIVAREPTDEGVLRELRALGIPSAAQARFDPVGLEDRFDAGEGQEELALWGFELVRDELLGEPGVAEGTGFGTNPGLNVHGKIFAMLVRSEFVVKLPRERCEELVSSGAAHPLEMGRRTMREWVRCPEVPRGEWPALAREALAFVRR